MPKQIILRHFTAYEFKVYFGRRSQRELVAIATMLLAATHDEIQAFRIECAKVYWDQQQAVKR